ncbi:hypothetical protein AKO1_006808 [Acrasis kona]|uniref:Endonuclease/exonuclease/phosphatase domain-containing protein n=1 Tax=Acrasis kona TaxID=1008807 RepID=A0AAW2YUN2_9EUKA
MMKSLGMSAFKVMSYNIRFAAKYEAKREYEWDYRKSGLVDVIKGQMPDVIGLQEVLSDQLDYIAQSLGDSYKHVGNAREYDSKNKSYRGEYSSVFYNTKKFQLLDQNTFWLSDNPDVPNEGPAWDADCVRICTWVLLKDLNSEKVFVHFNTHWDHVGPQARTNSAVLMRNRIMQMLVTLRQKGFKDPLISVSGDFNCLPDAKELSTMTEPLEDSGNNIKLQLTDSKSIAKSKQGPEGTFTFFDMSGNILIDYIFIQDGFDAIRKWDVDLYHVVDDLLPCGHVPSDHRPIVINLSCR